MAETPTEVVVTLPNEAVEPTVEVDLSAIDPNLPSGAADGVAADAETADEVTVREAKKHGWKPKELYKGPAERWTPADKFLERREEVMGVMRSTNESLRNELTSMRAEVERLRAADAERSQHSQQLSRETLKYELQTARETGDWAKVTELEDKLFTERAKDIVKPAPPQQTVAPVIQEAIETFEANNEWVKEDKMKKVLAETLDTMARAGSIAGLTPGEALEEAKDRIKRFYPEKFGSPRQRPPAFSETGGVNGASRGNTRTWNDLKPDVKARLEKMSADYGMTKEGLLRRCAENPSEYFRH